MRKGFSKAPDKLRMHWSEAEAVFICLWSLCDRHSPLHKHFSVTVAEHTLACGISFLSLVSAQSHLRNFSHNDALRLSLPLLCWGSSKEESIHMQLLGCLGNPTFPSWFHTDTWDAEEQEGWIHQMTFSCLLFTLECRGGSGRDWSCVSWSISHAGRETEI